PPGSGKTILAQQIAFSQTKNGKKALYLSTISEPALKLIRYQSQFDFFRAADLDKTFFYRSVGDEFRAKGFGAGFDHLWKMVDEYNPDIIIIDSFKAISNLASSEREARLAIYDLSLRLASHEMTTFLIGEYTLADISQRSEFAIADGILFLNLTEQEDQSRYLKVHKLRGSRFARGSHPFEIKKDGITCYPHPEPSEAERSLKLSRVSTYIPGLDQMSFGGFFDGSITIVAGSAGTGKTSLAMKFLGKKGLLVSFEEKPGRIERYAKNMQLEAPEVFYISPMQFIPERAVAEIKQMIEEKKPRRAVFDGLSAVTMEIDVLYDLIDFLIQRGITTVLIYELHDIFGTFSLLPTGVSRLVDNIILLRYVELRGKIERFITILKMRGSPHDTAIRSFAILPKEGLRIQGQIKGMSGLMTGIAQPVHHAVGEELAGGFRF
ncbi:hypothetical protein HY628_02640, partial [Candidatus Uhrbacteria bacterium]|nr:hypothetical protein [Candidatus Uhrbacteria bacterium]